MGKEGKKNEKMPPKKAKKSKVKKSMEKMLKRKTSQPITAQKDILLQFMKNNPKFARGELDAKEMKVLWKKLRKLLNKAGPKRSLRQWKKSWFDRKKGVKNKYEEAKKSKSVTISQADKDIAELVTGSVPEEMLTCKRMRESEKPTQNKKIKGSKASPPKENELEQALHLSALQHAYETLVHNDVIGENSGSCSKSSPKTVSVADLVKALQKSTCPPDTLTPTSAPVDNSKGPSKASNNSATDSVPGSSGIKNYNGNSDSIESSEDTSEDESACSTGNSSSSEDSESDNTSTEGEDDDDSSRINEKTMYSRVLEQQKNYYDRQLESQNEFFTWFKERYGTHTVPELMLKFRRHLEGIGVQLSLTVNQVAEEAVQDGTEELAERPLVNEEELAAEEIEYDSAPNGASFKKYLPQ